MTATNSEPYNSAVEDNINMYLSSGTRASPLLIHDNYIRGGYPSLPVTQSYSGGGVITDGNTKSTSNGTAYVNIYNNQTVATTNYGVAVAAGHDNSLYEDRAVNAGILTDGHVSSQMTVTQGSIVYNSATTLYHQTVTVTNNGSAVYNASLVLDSLSSNATFLNPLGSTQCVSPLGSPFVAIAATLGSGQTAFVTLQFADPTGGTIAYSTRVLAGKGQEQWLPAHKVPYTDEESSLSLAPATPTIRTRKAQRGPAV